MASGSKSLPAEIFAFLTVQNGDALGAVATDPAPRFIRPRSQYFQAAECGKDNRCRAFTFVRKKSEFWLKDRIGRTESRPGVELGTSSVRGRARCSVPCRRRA